MRAFIIAVINLMAFIAAGNAFQCLECTDLNAPDGTCDGIPTECPADVTSCDHTFVEFQFAGMDMNYQVFKSCSEKPCIPIHFTTTLTIFKGQFIRVCCEDDNCNNGAITLPPAIYTPNGKVCPSCFEENVDECVNINIKECTGEETGCGIFEGELDLMGGNPTKTVAYGCLNLESCDPPPLFPLPLVPITKHLTCSKAPEYSP